MCHDREISIDKLYIPCISQRQSEEQGVEQSVPHVDQRVPVLTNIVVVDVDIVVIIIFHFVLYYGLRLTFDSFIS